MITDIVDSKNKVSDIDSIIENFLNEYAITDTPIEVSFRALIPELRNIDRYTHLIHAYPAKLLVHIPYFFLNNTVFSKPGDIVLDPFCGTGTVLLESILSKRNAIGADANPLAQLIAKVKVRRYSIDTLNNTLCRLLNAATTSNPVPIYPTVVNIDYWFNNNNKNALLLLLNSIKLINDELIQEFFMVCFSNLIKKVSYADPRVSVPVRLNLKRYQKGSPNYKQVEKKLKELDSINVIAKFEDICKENISRFSLLEKVRETQDSNATGNVISDDARNLSLSIGSENNIPDNSVDLIITSPPYASAQKYIRSSGLNLGWLGFTETIELKHYDKLNIGRENYSKAEVTIKKTNITACDELITKISSINPLRAHIVSNYILEMQAALCESIRVLKPDGYFILIVGNNKVCNYEFNTQEYLSEFMINKGMKLVLKLIDDIKSYGLMTKRNKTADIISREWVLIFRKE